MKRNKLKWLALLITTLFILAGCQLFIEPSFGSMKSDSSSITQVKDSLFTGENFAILPKNERMEVTLKNHIDGDTTQFLLGGHKVKIRYLLIDTPETVKVNTEQQPFGKQASDRTKKLLEQSETIEIMLDKGDRTDHYNRLLAYVFIDGELIQDILIKEGLGRVAYIAEPNTTYLSQLVASEEQAQQNQIGIWSLDNYVTEKGFNPQ